MSSISSRNSRHPLSQASSICGSSSTEKPIYPIMPSQSIICGDFKKTLASYLPLLVLVVGLHAVTHASSSFTDNFSSYTQNTCFPDGTSFGPWTTVFAGFGCVQVESNAGQSWLDESPEVATSSSESHSSLVVGPAFSNPLTFSVSVNTVAQLRQGSAPNPWEVAWVIWHYTANNSFNYFIAKPNGWELGKETPSGQVFLATGSTPAFPIGQWYKIQISETTQNTITVYVNNHQITTFTDTQNPYTSGSIGLYDEDAHVEFKNVAVTTNAYDQTALGDQPVAFWDVSATANTEVDITGNGNTGTYQNGTPSTSSMPNGDPVAVFNGSNQYLTIPSNASFSIPTTGNLTWEAWIQPDVLQFPHSDSTGDYVDFMGKCDQYSPTCEWESRMYNTSTPNENPGRPNRLSAYVFNPSAGLGSGADWQPASSVIQAGQWLHVVAEYTTQSQPPNCPNASTYPGSINIWVNGVEWNQADHAPTGCMSQFSVTPQANNSPLNIGTMALDTWFEGAIGKVAIYNYLLSQTQINNHYQIMTGNQPTGSCGDTCSF